MSKPHLRLVHSVDHIEPPKDRGGWIQTFTGRPFWPADPRPEDIDIRDIAISLSRQCRFTGHTQKFYSVAEHSIRVSYACDQKDALWGLLHDASEAYLIDLAKPLKDMPEFAPYRDIEARVMKAVCEKFGLPVRQPESVTKADMVLLVTEKRDLMGECALAWKPLPVEPLSRPIQVMDPEYARQAFLWRFKALGGSVP